MSSIHAKITTAFSLMTGVIVLIAILAVIDLAVLERQITEGTAVAGLKDTALEMRRYEKNLFLYHDREALAEVRHYRDAAAVMLEERHQSLASVADGDALRTLEADLRQYAQVLARLDAAPEGDSRLEDLLRTVGHQITTATEEMAQTERRFLAESASRARWGLVIAILLVILAVAAIGRVFAAAVVKPLRRMEADLSPIADGRLDHLEARTGDRELVTFAAAFNRMLAELESRRRRLLQSEKLASLGVLVAGVAHELNNPLSNISSSAQLLIEELDAGDRKLLEQWSTQIVDETERARRIVSALLDFGRQGDFSLRPVALRKILDKTLILLRGPLRKSGARIELRVSEDIFILADEQRLQQVLINLIRNAMESTETTVSILVTATECALHSPQLPADAEVIGNPDCGAGKIRLHTQIVIQDDGPGIDPAILPRIFDPFFTTHEPGRGYGLGLYIVQEIVQDHEGCIAIASTPGEGTRVMLRLPCAEEND